MPVDYCCLIFACFNSFLIFSILLPRFILLICYIFFLLFLKIFFILFPFSCRFLFVSLLFSLIYIFIFFYTSISSLFLSIFFIMTLLTSFSFFIPSSSTLFTAEQQSTEWSQFEYASLQITKDLFVRRSTLADDFSSHSFECFSALSLSFFLSSSPSLFLSLFYPHSLTVFFSFPTPCHSLPSLSLHSPLHRLLASVHPERPTFVSLSSAVRTTLQVNTARN